MHNLTIPRLLHIAAVTVMLASASLACNIGQPADQAPQPTAALVTPVTGAGEGEVTPEATEALPPAPTPTTAADSAAPTEFAPPDAPDANAEYSGISFYRDNALASGWVGETIPPPDTTE